MKSGFCINPQTGRIINKKTAKYRRLVKLGEIVEEEPKVIKQILPKVEEVKKVEEVEFVPDIKPQLAEITTDIVKENKAKLAQELTPKQMDALLRKMLYDKLCLTPKKNKKQPKKKAKKTRFKLKEPSSSEEEFQSESESESE
jgi:hypothetical protein